MKTNIPERIAALREAMKQHKIDAYIIPTSDPHMSEYPADCLSLIHISEPTRPY